MRLLSAALSLALALLSAGPGASAALAQVVKAGPAAAVPIVPGAPFRLTPATPAPGSVLSAPVLPTVPSASPSLKAVPTAVLPVAAAAAPLALPAAAIPRLAAGPLSQPSVQAPAAPATALETLTAGVRTVGRAATRQRGAVLDAFFTGAAARSGANGVVSASDSAPNSRPLLAAPSNAALEAEAVDPASPLAERRAALAAVSKLGGAEAKRTLLRIAAANKEGPAADYEVHRAALRALAEDHGVMRSLRPVSRAHADELLSRLADAKPRLAVFDYDDTLEKNSRPASPETGAALKAASDAGVDVAILSGRAFAAHGQVSVLESLAPLTAEQKAVLTVAGRGGAELAVYDVQGREARLGEPAYAKRPKSDGMAVLRGRQAAFERLRELMRWGLPAAAADTVMGWLTRIPETPTAASETLLVGDQFFGRRSADSAMTRATPGALSISVGRKGDPRLDDLFVWPTKGHAASMELLGALAKPADDGGFDRKAVIGFFLARSLSIFAFILTTIAYPGLAAPVVGWTVFGSLLALGPLAAIAAGPANGRRADTLSPRAVMALNMAIRAALALSLPAFAYLGVLNFWTLLLSAAANGWALSATMTTDSAMVRRLAGRHQNAVQTLSSMNFVALQVLFGLLLGIGSYIDAWDPMTPFFISAAVHAFVIVPLVLTLLPGGKPAAEPAAPSAGGLFAFAKRYWKEGLLTAAAAAAYLAWQTVLPLSAALFYWVLQTDAVKALRAGDYREVAPREKELAAAIDEAASPAQAAPLIKEAAAWKSRQFMTVLYTGLQAAMTYPFQNFALPLIAVTLMGPQGKAMFLGKLLGALYFGNLISNAAQADLPDLRLPLLGRIPGDRVLKALILALAGAWVYTGLVPGSALAAAAAVAAAAALMWFASKVTPRGWIHMLGFGLAAVSLPAAVWFFPGTIPFLSVQTALLLGMLAFGLFVGPASVSLNIYQQNNTDKGDLGKVFGTGSSFFNTFSSFSYALLGVGAAALSPAFPALFVPIGAAFLVTGFLFWTAHKRLPGLPPGFFKQP
ncbi:MAG: hypothetical protein HYZ75_15845 [Elusimicrobia bacterium]|nr:hypothetical protein [Elusimicrobiota bacterium]